MGRTSVDVLVVGGGPAGMVCGCLLARAGLKTLVLERNDNFDREFRGEILQPRFHQAMRDAGLFDHIAGYPHEEVDAAHFYFQGRRIGGLNLRRLDRRSGTTWWMTQPDLLRALKDYGEMSANFEIRFGAALKALAAPSARVDGPDGEEEIEAKVIIGADGRFSTVRKLVDFELLYDHHEVDVIWFLLPRPEGYNHFFSFFLTPVHNYLILPKHPDLLQCGLVLKPGEFDSIRRSSIASLRDELTRAHPVFASYASELEDFSRFRMLKGNTALVADWARDGLVLIGDAAHTCSPAGGIGVAVAVETACVAAGVVLEAFEHDDFSARRLGAVQRLRQADVRKVHAIQGRIAGTVLGASPLMRRAGALAIGLASKVGLLPLIARRLLTQRRPLPLRRIGRT